MKFSFAAVFLPGLLLGQSIAMSQSVYRSTLIPPGHLRQDVSLEIVTPHIPFAKPRDGVPIKALFVGPAYGQRETAELAQRLSLDFDVLFTGTNASWTQPYLVEQQSTATEVIDALRQKLKSPRDCIVIGNFDWSLIPDDIVETIGRSVKAGGGLVHVMYSGQQFPDMLQKLLTPDERATALESVVPIAAMRELTDYDGRAAIDALPDTRHFTFGKGRVALIRYPGYPPAGVRFLTPDPNHPLAYEYCQAYLIKNVIYASGLSPSTSISAIDIKPQSDINETRSARVQLAGDGDAGLKLHWSVRDPRGDVIASGQQDASKTSVELPHTPAGLHFLDISLKNEQGEVVDFASAAFRVISPITISSIELLNDTLPTDGSANGQVVVAGDSAHGGPPENAVVNVQLFDNYNRLYAQATLPDKEHVRRLGTFAQSHLLWFSLPVRDSLTTINRVRAELRINGKLLSVAEREFYVPRYPKDDFIIGVWGIGERIRRWSHIASQMIAHERSVGVDAELLGHFYADPGEKTLEVAGITRSNVSVYPYIERISNFEDDLVRNPCLTDPAYLQRRLGEHRQWARMLEKYGCLAFNLGDEINLSAKGVDVCFSPSCQESFRHWLEKSYGTLDKLNASWGTNYAAWSEVTPITRADAQKDGRMAQWLDHRLHMTDVMMNFMVKVSDTIASQIPGARSGPEGIWGTDPYYAVDWGQLAARLDVVFPYMDEAMAFTSAGSLARAGSLSGTWMGGYPHRGLYEGMARYDPWYALLHGLNSAWFYASYDGAAIIHPYCAFGPDFRFNQSGKWFFEEAAKIKSGIGKLVLNSQRQRDGIAVLYSSPSAYLQPTSANDWILALRDAGYQCDVITIPQLIAGELMRFRALVLPNSIAMSDEEASAIKAFVENGGIVLADMLPATHDQHGRKRQRSALADVFGGSSAASTVDPTGARAAIAPTLGVDVTEGSATTRDSSAIQSSSPFRIQDLGKGKALHGDFGLHEYATERQYARRRDVAAAMGQTLRELNIMPVVSIESNDGGPLPIQGLEVIRHTFAGGELLAVLREELTAATDENAPCDITLRLPESAHAYDLRTGQALGRRDALEMTTTPGSPLLLALLAAEPGALALSAPASVRAGEELELSVALPGAKQDVAHIELLGPNGAPATWHTQNVLLSEGTASVKLKLALNAGRGTWTARARNVLTGKTAQTTFNVE